jgi:Mg2+ and Co2+ transporter CorA
MVGQQYTDFSHQDLQIPRIKRNESDFQSFVQLIETSWLNPFNTEQEELGSLSTATAAPPEVANDPLGTYRI